MSKEIWHSWQPVYNHMNNMDAVCKVCPDKTRTQWPTGVETSNRERLQNLVWLVQQSVDCGVDKVLPLRINVRMAAKDSDSFRFKEIGRKIIIASNWNISEVNENNDTNNNKKIKNMEDNYVWMWDSLPCVGGLAFSSRLILNNASRFLSDLSIPNFHFVRRTFSHSFFLFPFPIKKYNNFFTLLFFSHFSLKKFLTCPSHFFNHYLLFILIYVIHI